MVEGVLVGALLSDGWLQKSKQNWNARFGIKQSVKFFNYLWHLFTLLSPLCSSVPYLSVTRKRGKLFYALTIQTRAYPCLNELYTMFIVDNKKVVPYNIYNLLTPIALAHWIMGDGSVRNEGLTLCTESFTLSDVIRLMNVLRIKYLLDCSVHYNLGKPRIYILKSEMSKLREIVGPYMEDSMLYKLQGTRKVS